jgi:hypothetical protein
MQGQVAFSLFAAKVSSGRYFVARYLFQRLLSWTCTRKTRLFSSNPSDKFSVSKSASAKWLLSIFS